MASSLELSIVLPAYRSAPLAERHLPVLDAYLETLGVSTEVIVVDDGSCDDGATAAVVQRLGHTFLCNPGNQGKGAAVRRGMLAACGRYRIFTDIDVPYDLANIERMLYYLNLDDYHMVVGDRTLVRSNYFGKIRPVRMLASHVYSTIVGLLIAGGRFDTQCGLKGFRDHVAEDVFGVGVINRFAFDVELFCIAVERDYDIKKIPVQLRCDDQSSVSVVSDGITMLRDLTTIRVNQMMGRYAAGPR